MQISLRGIHILEQRYGSPRPTLLQHTKILPPPPINVDTLTGKDKDLEGN